MIDLDARHLSVVKEILREHVPDCEVRAFGSRVTGTAKKFSDLDLVIVCESKVSPALLGRIEEAFQESDLPIRVDVLDWHDTSESFQEIIEEKFEVVQERGVKWGRGTVVVDNDR